jgi:putative nucleic acid modification protein with dual OB domain
MGRSDDLAPVTVPTFEILCLANSYKHRGRCIAGLRTDGGGWVRLCAPTPGGEVHPCHYLLQDGSGPKALDVIRVECDQPQPSAHQPENWLISGAWWELVHRPAPAALANVLRANVTLGPLLFGDTKRRISFARFADRPANASLALIAPTDIEWRITHKPFKPRAQFRLRGTPYDLPVTDPAWLDTFRELGDGTHPLAACGIEPGRKVLLTVSLGEPFDEGNYCYKLVAAIIPLPLAWVNTPRIGPGSESKVPSARSLSA